MRCIRLKSFIDRLCAPSCMQCRSPMTMALYPGLMLATYECSVCGMRIARLHHQIDV